MPGTAKRPTAPRGDSRTLAEIRERLARVEALLVALAREFRASSARDAEELASVEKALADPERIPLDEILASVEKS